MSPSKRFRNYWFTHNNYLNTNVEDTLECRYIAYAHEVGEEGTPHLQGMVSFTNAVTYASVIKKMPGCSIGNLCGTVDQAIHYFDGRGKKDKTTGIMGPPYEPDRFTERGDRPVTNDDKGTAERLRWIRLKQLAKAGDMDTIDREFPREAFKDFNLINRIHRASQPQPQYLDKVCGIWIYGKSGVGKSRLVINQFPDHYVKLRKIWWDNYNNEETVVMDDVSPTNIHLVDYFKDWADFKPFRAEVKGGSLYIRPKRFIVTSQYHPNDMGFNKEDLEAVLRRYQIIELTKENRMMVKIL